jgi:hypothetical protein
VIRVHAHGAYAHRQPLAYATLAPQFRARIRPVARAEEADAVLFAHTKDIDASPAPLRRLLARPGGPRAVLLSEEPFWDTIWGVSPWLRHRRVETPEGGFALVTLNHLTSRIFEAERIPYYLLTDHRFPARYGAMAGRLARVPEREWLARWRAAPVRAAFVAERRRSARFDYRPAEAPDLRGLAAWRTRLAEATGGHGVLRLGRGWQGGPPRQRLDDWHFDKLARLAGRCRTISAVENTHAPAYLTEKLYDAFACGAVPLYYAGPGHLAARVAPPEAWLNLWDLPVEAAAEAVRGFAPDLARAEAYRLAQARLAETFATGEAVAAEAARLARAVTAELEGALAEAA